MGLNIRKSMPLLLSSGRRSVYFYDALPGIHEKVRQFISDWKIDYVFLSSSQAAESLCDPIPGCRTAWIPEGITPERYRYLPGMERDIDVIQFGCKYDDYHARIAAPLEKAGRSYLYEKGKGDLIFPSWEHFVDGLARSKVSVCFPANITHPERAGDIETMTARYLQSMASKCLVIGHAPREMVALFGYNPVVEADMGDPAGQLLSILDHFDDYNLLIERNYREVTEKHTWRHGWAKIKEVLFP